MLATAVAYAVLNDGVIPADILGRAETAGFETATLEADVEQVLGGVDPIQS